jgi:hypothetical protein
MVALYATAMSIFVAVIRSNITSTQFKVFMISSIFMALMSIVILIIFVIKTTYLFQNIDIRNTRSPEIPIIQSYPSPPRQTYSRPNREDTGDLDIDNDGYEDRRV